MPFTDGMCELYLNCKDNIIIHGLYVPSKRSNPIILYFHGNAGNITHRITNVFSFYKLGYPVLIIDYHGYGKSEGTPTENNLYLDGEASLNWLFSKGYKESEIIIYAKSLGGGIGIELATKYKFKGLILESTFSSLTSVAQSIYPFIPASLLIWDKFDNIFKINEVQTSLLILHGKEDNFINPNESIRLFNNANEPKILRLIEDASHNDVQYSKKYNYWKELNNWIDSLENKK